MRRVLLVLNVFLIVLLLWFVAVDVAFADEGSGDELPQALATQFAPIIAATVAIERFLQMVRNLISPEPDAGPLARKSKALRYYTTIGGVVLGLIIVLLSSDLRLLVLADIKAPPIVDIVVTTITIGMGTEFTHEAIKLLAEGKGILRSKAQS